MSAPVAYTCPSIDRVIGAIRRAQRNAEDGRKVADQNAGGDHFDEIINELWGLDDSMEDLRTSNSELRDWGDDLEQEKGDLQQEVQDLEEKVSDLERRLQRHESLEKDPNQLEIENLW